MFSEASICSRGEEVGQTPLPQNADAPEADPPLEGRPFPKGRPPLEGRTPPEDSPPHYWHLLSATAAVGTHPTGMHSC